MKRTLLLYFIINYLLFAQQDTITTKTPEIELPDFVITGMAKIEMPTHTKSIPDAFTPLSPEFILPKIRIESLKLEGLSDPEKQYPSIIDTSTKYTARASLGSGFYLLPILNLFYANSLNKMKFSLISEFENQRKYEDYSNYTKLKLGFTNTYIFEKKGNPPARFALKGTFDRLYFSNFKSEKPDEFKSINNLHINGVFENLFWREFNVTVGGTVGYQKITQWDYELLKISPFLTTQSTYEHFELKLTAEPSLYRTAKNYIENKLVLAARGEMYFRRVFKTLSFIARMDYHSEKEDKNQFLAPSFFLGMGFSNFWNMSIFYINNVVNFTPIDLWGLNPYLDSNSYKISFERIKNRIGFGTIIYLDRLSNLQLEFSRYDILGKNVFISANKKGFFESKNLETERVELKMSLLVNFRKFGESFIQMKYLNSKLKQYVKKEPHAPEFQLKFSYKYEFDFPLSLKISFSYNSFSYGDTMNLMKIDSYKLLVLSGEYQFNKMISTGILINNLLNKKNYLWYNYTEKPIDFTIYLLVRF